MQAGSRGFESHRLQLSGLEPTEKRNVKTVGSFQIVKFFDKFIVDNCGLWAQRFFLCNTYYNGFVLYSTERV